MTATRRQRSAGTTEARGEPIALCFSGGKDSVLAFREIQRQSSYAVVALVTTVAAEYDRVSMHGVRRALVRDQAAALGVRLTEVEVPPNSSNVVYEREMGRAFARLSAQGIRRVAFGDIFLQDLRTYREQQLAACGLEGLFPLWRQDTTHLAQRFIDDEFRAVVVCVNPSLVNPVAAGRPFDRAFLAALSPSVDPCGENGEFHTFVFDGPLFRRPIPVRPGLVMERDGFVFCDLVRERAADARLPSQQEVER